MTGHPQAPRRSGAEQCKLDAALTELFEQKITFNRTIGLKVLRLGKDRSWASRCAPNWSATTSTAACTAVSSRPRSTRLPGWR